MLCFRGCIPTMYRLIVIAIYFSLGTCEHNRSQFELSDLLSGETYEFLDLTHAVDNDTIVWPNSERFHNTRQFVSNDGYWYAVNDFCVGEHGGTHLDAPYHFSPNGMQVGQLPITSLITMLLVIDVSEETAGNASFILRKDHVEKKVKYLLNGIKSNVTILFRFGWGQYYGDAFKYLGGNTTDSLNFPGIGKDVSDFIVENFTNVVGVGLDTASVDPGSSITYDTHRTFSLNNIYNIENAIIPYDIPVKDCVAIVMPMKIRHGTGAPLRLTAICPKYQQANGK